MGIILIFLMVIRKMILKLYLLFLFFENDNWDNKCNKKIILTLCNKKAPKNYIITCIIKNNKFEVVIFRLEYDCTYIIFI